MSKHVKQLELGIEREYQPDRNHIQGGRSFYFFDLDDNVLFLSTTIFIFHKVTGQEIGISTADFVTISRQLGQPGPYKDYEVRYHDQTGSFRRFRDRASDQIIANRLKQPFVEDLAEALGLPEFRWKGPSWDCFYHACFNQRPVAVITARGHHPLTIRDGLGLLHRSGYLPSEPNYLGIYPVSNVQVRTNLGDDTQQWSIAKLKQAAIMESVENAMQVHGLNAHHRFGMSDDSPENLELIVETMKLLKQRYPENSFFVIDTHQERFLKQEIFLDRIESRPLDVAQLELFDSP